MKKINKGKDQKKTNEGEEINTNEMNKRGK